MPSKPIYTQLIHRLIHSSLERNPIAFVNCMFAPCDYAIRFERRKGIQSEELADDRAASNQPNLAATSRTGRRNAGISWGRGRRPQYTKTADNADKKRSKESSD